MVSENNQPDKIINITCVKDYLIELSDIFDNNPINNPNHHYFYRGQQEHTEEVLPCLLRDNLFSSEARIIKDAYGRRPAIFREQNTPFERLTKLQHYGLKTRLLDLTLNPLVALFFACQTKDEEDHMDGVVYIYDSDSYDYDSKEIKIHAAISEMDIKNGISIKNLFMNLKDLGVITSLDYKQYRNGNHLDFINILEKDYFVISNLSNDRLIQQSGAFYLPGCIEVLNRENIENCSIHKVCGKGVEKYQSYEFNILADYKEDLLNELDLYNINSASLFPELDYQMRYINDTHSLKRIHKTNKTNVIIPTILSGNEEDKTSEGGLDETNAKSEPELRILAEAKTDDKLADILLTSKSSSSDSLDDDTCSREIITKVVDSLIPDGISKEGICSLFFINLKVDWYKNQTIISNIHKGIKRTLYNSHRYSPEDSNKLADEIVSKVIEQMRRDD